MSAENFKIKNGLSVGNNEIIDSSGNIITSGTIAGRDISADGTKLDGIENNATADQTITAGTGLTGGGTGDVTISHADTSTQVSLTALTGANVISDIDVDGFGHVTSLSTRTMSPSDIGALPVTGKATDSDKLDGLNSTQFLRSDTTDTFTTLSGTSLTTNNLTIGTSNKIKFTNDDYIRYDDTANVFHFDIDSGTSNASLQASTFIGDLSGNAETADKLTNAVDLSLTGDVLGTVTTDLSGNVELVVTNIKPEAPTNLSFNIIDEDIELIFTKSITNSDKYEIFGSSDNIHFNIVKVVNSDDITDNIVVIDDTFDNIGNQYYKIYAVKSGVYSDALTGTFNFPNPNLDVTDLQINPSLEGFIVQWDNPDSKFYKAVNVYMDKNSASASLDRNNATLLYQGDTTNYVYNVPDADIDLFHQFWVEVV